MFKLMNILETVQTNHLIKKTFKYYIYIQKLKKIKLKKNENQLMSNILKKFTNLKMANNREGGWGC